MGFDEIVDGLDVEPADVALLRVMLFDDWMERHPGDPLADVAREIIDETVDDLREYWYPGDFDRFVTKTR